MAHNSEWVCALAVAGRAPLAGPRRGAGIEMRGRRASTPGISPAPRSHNARTMDALTYYGRMSYGMGFAMSSKGHMRRACEGREGRELAARVRVRSFVFSYLYCVR